MKRKFVRISVILLLLVGLPLIGWRAFLAIVINKKLADIRAAGLPTNGEEVNRWYPAVPDNQNAALLMTQAFALRKLYPDNRTNLVFNFELPRRGKRLSPEQSELLRGYVAMNEARMIKADEALQLPACRYSMDCSQLMNTPLPHLTWLKGIAELHQYSALLALEAGNPMAASSNVVTMLALARTLDKEPLLISQLVRLRIVGMAFEIMEHRTGGDAFSSIEIENISGAFTQTQTTNLMVNAMIGDRAMMMPYFRMSRAELDKLHPPKGGNESDRNSNLPGHGPAILRLIGYYELDYATNDT